MKSDVIHNFLVTMSNNAENADVRGILVKARLMIEELIVKDLPKLLPEETQLATKQLKVEAYRRRTGLAANIAHTVVNQAWRESQVHKDDKRFNDKVGQTIGGSVDG